MTASKPDAVIEVSSLVADRLHIIIVELEAQVGMLAHSSRPEEFPLADQLAQVREYIRCDEGGIAYEVIVAVLEKSPVSLSGRSVIALLEVGLFLGYKTDRPEDALFDRRHG
jgi:hypothetical protein